MLKATLTDATKPLGPPPGYPGRIRSTVRAGQVVGRCLCGRLLHLPRSYPLRPGVLVSAVAVPAPDHLVHRQRQELACTQVAGPVAPASGSFPGSGSGQGRWLATSRPGDRSARAVRLSEVCE